MSAETLPFSTHVRRQLRKAARLVDRGNFADESVVLDPRGGPPAFDPDEAWIGRIEWVGGRSLWFSPSGFVSIRDDTVYRMRFDEIDDVVWPPTQVPRHEILRTKRSRGDWLEIVGKDDQRIMLAHLGASFQDIYHLFRLILRARGVGPKRAQLLALCHFALVLIVTVGGLAACATNEIPTDRRPGPSLVTVFLSGGGPSGHSARLEVSDTGELTYHRPGQATPCIGTLKSHELDELRRVLHSSSDTFISLAVADYRADFADTASIDFVLSSAPGPGLPEEIYVPIELFPVSLLPLTRHLDTLATRVCGARYRSITNAIAH